MLNSGTKLCALRYKKKNILTLVLSEKKILNETKNHHKPPFKLNGRSLTQFASRDSLYYETGWEPLSCRRKSCKLTTFYKMHN